MNASIFRFRRSTLAKGLSVAALLLVAVVSAFGAFSGGLGSHTVGKSNPQRVVATLAASYATDWKRPSDARLSLEAHTDLLSRIAATHGGDLRILSTTSTLRTRSASGARLAQPLALLERTFELQLSEHGDTNALLASLAEASFRVADVSGRLRVGEAERTRLSERGRADEAIRMAGDK